MIAGLAHAAETFADKNPTGPAGEFNGQVTTAGSYDPSSGNAKRVIEDLAVPGAVGDYPLKWDRILNTGFTLAHGNTFSGGGWSHSYDWVLWVHHAGQENPPEPPANEDPLEGIGVIVYYPDGRRVQFRNDDGPVHPSFNGYEPGDRLVERTDLGADNYDLLMTDGGMVEFRRGAYTNGGPTQYGSFAVAIVDPHGLTTTLVRDTGQKLVQVREPAGRYLEIGYSQSRDRILTVKSFDGRPNFPPTTQLLTCTLRSRAQTPV
ncbi:MAG: hypothetical protein ACR2ID_09245, partial [Chthoniobacterales bacterium]